MHVVIAGAGITGLTTSFYLARKHGVRSTLVDRTGSVAPGASGKAAGFLARDWNNGTPTQDLTRRSFDLHQALADEAGQELVQITAGDPSHEVNGEQVLAWYFLTDKGPHYMVEVNGIASMYDAETDELVSELEIVFE